MVVVSVAGKINLPQAWWQAMPACYWVSLLPVGMYLITWILGLAPAPTLATKYATTFAPFPFLLQQVCWRVQHTEISNGGF